MTDRLWYAPPTDPDEARRRRETIYLEILYRGRTLADNTGPPRFCLNHPNGTPDIDDNNSTPDTCLGCLARAKRFDAWVSAQ
jgi:hypothetical protein